jgi:hypothetical protein
MKRKNYDDVLDAISELVDKKKTVKEKVTNDSKDLLAKYTREYFAEVESLIAGSVATYELLLRSFTTYKIRIRSIDPGANVVTYWNEQEIMGEDGKQISNRLESIDRVRIIWSNAYCLSNGIDKEITIDQFDCLLRS